jgi:hypothetical protein
MKTITTSKSSLTTILGLLSVLILVALAFVGLFLAQRMQAVNPPPDGVRPGETQRKGRAPCLTPPAAHLTQRLVRFPSRAISKFNAAVGAVTLFTNTANHNTGSGAGGLLSNTIGIENTANGSLALSNSSSKRN